MNSSSELKLSQLGFKFKKEEDYEFQSEEEESEQEEEEEPKKKKRSLIKGGFFNCIYCCENYNNWKEHKRICKFDSNWTEINSTFKPKIRKEEFIDESTIINNEEKEFVDHDFICLCGTFKRLNSNRCTRCKRLNKLDGTRRWWRN